MNVARQSLWLVLLQYLTLAALFCARYLSYPIDSEVYALTPIGPAEGFPLLPSFIIRKYYFEFGQALLFVSSLAVVLISLLVVRSMIKNLILPSRSYLPLVLYLLFSCGIFFGAASFTGTVSALLIIWACRLFTAAFARSRNFDAMFKGSFLVGCAVLIEPVTVVALLIIPVALLVFRRNSAESVVATFALILPMFLWSYAGWFAGNEFTAPVMAIADTFSLNLFTVTAEVPSYLRGACVATSVLLIMAAIIRFSTRSRDMRTRAVRVTTFMIIFFIISAAGLLFTSDPVSLIPTAAIPASFIVPLLFNEKRGYVLPVIYLAVLLLFIFTNIWPLVV